MIVFGYLPIPPPAWGGAPNLKESMYALIVLMSEIGEMAGLDVLDDDLTGGRRAGLESSSFSPHSLLGPTIKEVR